MEIDGLSPVTAPPVGLVRNTKKKLAGILGASILQSSDLEHKRQ